MNKVVRHCVSKQWLVLVLSVFAIQTCSHSHHFCNGVTTVVMKKHSLRQVHIVRQNHLADSDSSPIQMLTTATNRKLPGSKADTTTIQTVRLYLIARKMTPMDQAQPDQHANAMEIVFLQHQSISASKGMESARPAVIVRKEPNKSNLEFFHVACVVCW